MAPEGDIALDPFTLKVRNGMPAIGTMCIDEPVRLQQFIDHDKAHEDKHADVIRDAFEPYDLAAGFPNGTDFPTQTNCTAAAAYLADQARIRIENTIIAEDGHPNHAGQQRTQRACPVQPGGPALPIFEEWCGNMNGNTPFVLFCQHGNTW